MLLLTSHFLSPRRLNSDLNVPRQSKVHYFTQNKYNQTGNCNLDHERLDKDTDRIQTGTGTGTRTGTRTGTGTRKKTRTRTETGTWNKDEDEQKDKAIRKLPFCCQCKINNLTFNWFRNCSVVFVEIPAVSFMK